MRHAERPEDFALAEHTERFIGEAFEDDAENDEADVAVFGARTGGSGKRRGEGGLQKFFTSLGAQEKLFVGGQAGAVGKQHAQRDLAAASIMTVRGAGEFGDDSSHRGFEIEQPALVEDHRHASRGDDFSQRRKIKDACGRDPGRSRIICEAAEGLMGDEFSAEGDRERAGGEGAAGDGLFQNAERTTEAIILRSEIAREEGETGFSIGQRQVQGHFVN